MKPSIQVLVRGRHCVLRFLNPWVDVAHNVTRQPQKATALAQEVTTYTEIWGLVSVLLCGLSITSLGAPPCISNSISNDQNNNDKKDTETLLMSLRLTSGREDQHDAYVGACTMAFFASAASLGLSTVINVLTSVTPVHAIQALVLRHSWQLCAIPGLTALSGGLVGVALVVGVDLTNRPNVAWLALGGFGGTSLLVAGAALHGQWGLYRALAAASRLPKRVAPHPLFRGQPRLVRNRTQ